MARLVNDRRKGWDRSICTVRRRAGITKALPSRVAARISRRGSRSSREASRTVCSHRHSMPPGRVSCIPIGNCAASLYTGGRITRQVDSSSSLHHRQRPTRRTSWPTTRRAWRTRCSSSIPTTSCGIQRCKEAKHRQQMRSKRTKGRLDRVFLTKSFP